MTSSARGDFFDRARAFAAAAMLLAGALAIVGSALDWVTITKRDVVAGTDFGDEEVEPGQGQAFQGLDDRDGRYILIAGVVVIASAIALLVRKRSGAAWLGFIAAMVVGGIAFADYRCIGNNTCALSQRMDVGTEARPAVGMTLVAAAGIIGVVASVAGVAATPQRDASAAE